MKNDRKKNEQKRYRRYRFLSIPCFDNRLHLMEATYEGTVLKIGKKGKKIWRWKLVFQSSKDLGVASKKDIEKYQNKRMIVAEW